LKQIKKIWAGVFQLPADHRLSMGVAAEVFLIGERDDSLRFSVEHEPAALLSLIAMCRKIAHDEGVAWRLLEFEEHREVPEEEIQEWLNCCASASMVH